MNGARLSRRRAIAATACGFACVVFTTRSHAKPRAGGWTVETTAGETVTGETLAVADGSLRTDDRAWRWEELVAAASAGPVDVSGERGWAELTGGDRLFGSVGTFAGDAVTLTRPGPAAPLALPAAGVRAVRFAAPGPPTEPHRQTVRRDAGADDLVLLRVGGRVAGELLGWDAAGPGAAVRVRAAAGEIAVPRADVRAVSLSPELQFPTPDPPTFAAVTLADGSTLTAASLRYADDGGDLTTPGGVTVPIAAGDLRGLLFYSPSVRAAGEPAVTFEPTPAGEVPPVRDRTTTGRRAVAGGRPHPRGWGVWGGTTLRFPVPPGATRFVTAFALDRSAGEAGEVTARVRLGDAVAWERIGVRAGDLLPVRLDVGGAGAVSLEVIPGPLPGVREEAFWVAPRFVVIP